MGGRSIRNRVVACISPIMNHAAVHLPVFDLPAASPRWSTASITCSSRRGVAAVVAISLLNKGENNQRQVLSNLVLKLILLTFLIFVGLILLISNSCQSNFFLEERKGLQITRILHVMETLTLLVHI